MDRFNLNLNFMKGRRFITEAQEARLDYVHTLNDSNVSIVCRIRKPTQLELYGPSPVARCAPARRNLGHNHQWKYWTIEPTVQLMCNFWSLINRNRVSSYDYQNMHKCTCRSLNKSRRTFRVLERQLR